MTYTANVLREMAQETPSYTYLFRRWVTALPHDNEQMQVVVIRSSSSLNGVQLLARMRELVHDHNDKHKQFLLVHLRQDISVELDTYEFCLEYSGDQYKSIEERDLIDYCPVHYTNWWIDGAAVEVKVKGSWDGRSCPFEI